MKVIDALLLKLAEETTELTSIASDAGQLCSKAVRFGMDSYHPDDLNRVTNENLLATALASVQREYHDVTTFQWLLFYYQNVLLRLQPMSASEQEQYGQAVKYIFHDEEGLSNAVTKLDTYARYSGVMVERGTMTSARHIELMEVVASARAFLMSLKVEPFAI